jgi:hypothetical protein
VLTINALADPACRKRVLAATLGVRGKMRAPSRLIDTSALAPQEREAPAREFLETITDVDVRTGDASPTPSPTTRSSPARTMRWV